MNAETLICLIYRLGGVSRCRQYPFHTFMELEKFCSRHPYKNESLMVLPVVNGKQAGRFVCEAWEAVPFLKSNLESQGVDISGYK